MYDSLIRAYDQARRVAALRGVPASQNEMMESLAPVYARYARDAVTTRGLELQEKALKQDQMLFNAQMAMNDKIRKDQRPFQWADIALSGAGTLLAGVQSSKQEEELRKRLAMIQNLYGGK